MTSQRLNYKLDHSYIGCHSGSASNQRGWDDFSMAQSKSSKSSKSHLLQIQCDGHILILMATLQRWWLPPALLKAGDGRDQRFNRSLLGPIWTVSIADPALLGPLAMWICIYQFTVFLGSILSTGRIHRYRGTRCHIKDSRVKTANTSGAHIIRLLTIEFAHSWKRKFVNELLILIHEIFKLQTA